MKNKIIYLFFLVFLASLISSAKKTPGSPVCSKVKIQKSKEAKKTEPGNETEIKLPSLGLFFFNI